MTADQIVSIPDPQDSDTWIYVSFFDGANGRVVASSAGGVYSSWAEAQTAALKDPAGGIPVALYLTAKPS